MASAGIDGVLAEIRTESLPNTGLQRYRYVNLLDLHTYKNKLRGL
jgi:hypothetical protein